MPTHLTKVRVWAEFAGERSLSGNILVRRDFDSLDTAPEA